MFIACFTLAVYASAPSSTRVMAGDPGHTLRNSVVAPGQFSDVAGARLSLERFAGTK